MSDAETRYVPALRFRSFTRLYDPIVRLSSREAKFKRRLIEIAGLLPGERVLDLGCGTGTLAIAAKEAEPEVEMIGVDGDPEVLARARAKADSASVEIAFERGLSFDLAFQDSSFDVVLSTLFFHHLEPAQKRDTAREIARVLRPGGRLLVADWGPPRDLAMRAAFLLVRVLDGFELTRENAEGALPSIFTAAGLPGAQVAELRTLTGSMAFFRATASDSPAGLSR